MKAAIIAASLISTTAISLAPNLILYLAPNFASSHSKQRNNLLSIGQALAAGCLLGDVFLHTLPHCFLGHDEAGAQNLGLSILGGFFTFFVLDILIRSLDDSFHDPEHDHNHKGCRKEDNTDASSNIGAEETETLLIFSPTVLLNLAADSLHNFTDGITIGASFASASFSDDVNSLSLLSQIAVLLRSRGGVASLAVLLHEIPHELGDFAVLVSAGMSKRQAIRAQFGTALAAYCGTLVGLMAMERMRDFVGFDLMVPFTAGGFLYLSSVSILPGLLQEKVTKISDRCLLVLAFIVGIGFMYGVALLEDHNHGHGDHHHDHHHGGRIQSDHHHDETCHLSSDEGYVNTVNNNIR